jgi:magnesium-transporting ATPase (P-type)
LEEEEEVVVGAGRVIPEDMLQTDTRVGLTSEEVIQRRRKYGLNQMKEEKENMILKFLGFFVGPIQFVMEVRQQKPRGRFVSFLGIAALKRNNSPHAVLEFYADPSPRLLLFVSIIFAIDSSSHVFPTKRREAALWASQTA